MEGFVKPITDVRDIARIAYGFKASKALLVAVDLELFSRLSVGAKSLTILAKELGLAENRLDTLLTALTSIGLLVRDGDAYTNAPACEDYLVCGKPAYFGDYFNLQTDKFIFPAYNDLGAVIAGSGASDVWHDYESLMKDAETADRFSKGQHAGSMGPAIALSRQVDLSSKRRMLDVAGGSGAFTIMLCKRNSELSSTILDFPTALPVPERQRRAQSHLYGNAHNSQHRQLMIKCAASKVDRGRGRMANLHFSSLLVNHELDLICELDRLLVWLVALQTLLSAAQVVIGMTGFSPSRQPNRQISKCLIARRSLSAVASYMDIPALIGLAGVIAHARSQRAACRQPGAATVSIALVI